MRLYNVKLLTITCEALVQKKVFEILIKHHVSGYTTYEVEGLDPEGVRGQGFLREKNVKTEVVLKEDKLQDILEEISRTLSSYYAIIFYVSDVGVLRPERYD